MSLVLTLWVLPALITSLTPLTYRQVVGQTRDVLVTAFATGSALIVLPLIIERSKELLRQSALSTADTEATVEVIIPAFTSFPKIGTLLPIACAFAGWLSGNGPGGAVSAFAVTGLVTSWQRQCRHALANGSPRIPSICLQQPGDHRCDQPLCRPVTIMNNLTPTLAGTCRQWPPHYTLGGCCTLSSRLC
jgi:hypothetical protein